ncbi:hypothetical protein DFQ26_009458 [Actinomortierella ambigua]|nr:hypothetical protein DFQ26_009458 [Actinomortierella ambigua]
MTLGTTDSRQVATSTSTMATTPTTTTTTNGPVTTPAAATTSIPITHRIVEPHRPSIRPSLLTEQEYKDLWDPQPDKFRLGVLLPFNTPKTDLDAKLIRNGFSAIKLAVKHINEQKIIPGVNVSILVCDSQQSALYSIDGGAAISAAGRLITNKVGAVIGDIHSELTRYEALMTSSIQIPQCSYASASTRLSDTTVYPYFFRTIPTAIVLLDAMLNVVEHLKWRRITILYDVTVMGWEAGEPYDVNFTEALQRTKEVASRIQFLVSAGKVQSDLLYAARNAGLMTAEYAWVLSNEISDMFRDEVDRRDFDGLIMVDNGWNLRGYPPYENFLKEWIHLNTTEYPGAGDATLENNEGLAYSCAMMIAYAYGDVVRRYNMHDGQYNRSVAEAVIRGDMSGEVVMTDFYMNRAYQSPAGPITLDDKGDRVEGYYIASTLQDGYPHHFGLILANNYSSYTPPVFKDGSLTPPRDAPLWSKIRRGTTVAASPLELSLTVKNYRIYRIFNSVGFSNEVFQTRLLMRYVFMILALCVIPAILQAIMDKPMPTTINIRQYQWVQCQSEWRVTWFIGGAILPVVLVLFGVYLAFRTRNVVFLWNEARQISLVL